MACISIEKHFVRRENLKYKSGLYCSNISPNIFIFQQEYKLYSEGKEFSDSKACN